MFAACFISIPKTFLNICVKNDHGYVPFVVIIIWFFPHSWFIIGFVIRAARHAPSAEQELQNPSGAPEFPPAY